MSTSNPIEALETVNEEYNELLMSLEYRIGKRVLKLAAALKKVDVSAIAAFVRSLVTQRKLGKSVNTLSVHEKDRVSPLEVEKAASCPVTVYACVTNGYDVPLAPLYVPPNISSVLFADEVTVKMIPQGSGFHIHLIERTGLLASSGNANRYCKLHPGKFVVGDFSIYTDGNVRLISDVAEWCAIARASEAGVAMYSHSSRECVYEEAQACLVSKRGDAEAIRRQMERYRFDGFPYGFGMCEATVIVADLRNPRALRLLSAWWEEYRASGSGRDQLALPYVLWKEGYSIESVGCLGPDVWNSPKLRIHDLGSHSFR